MPKQSRVKKPKPASIDLVKYFDEIFQRLCKLRCEMSAHLHSEMQQLNGRIGSDFQDQDDEIEKISRRLQSVEDKLKAKQLGEQTNVELTARVKELQRQLTDANDQLEKARANKPSVRVVETLQLDDGRLADREYVGELCNRIEDLNASVNRIRKERDQWEQSAHNLRNERIAETERADRAEAELTGVRLALADHTAARKPRFWWFGKRS